jgi:hypothetical protein
MDQYEQLNQALTKFSTGAYKRYSSHSFEAGYFHALILKMYYYLPDEQKAAIIDQLEAKCAEYYE